MNCAQDITRYIILNYLQPKEKVRFGNTCTENYNMVLDNLKIRYFDDLICSKHNILDECSYIVPNTCRLCCDNYCHRCYKITDKLNRSWITARREDFDYNFCENCVFKCITCNQEEEETTEKKIVWYTSYEDPVHKYLTFNDYYRSTEYNNISIEYCKGYYKYQTQHQCEECAIKFAAEELFNGKLCKVLPLED